MHGSENRVWVHTRQQIIDRFGPIFSDKDTVMDHTTNRHSTKSTRFVEMPPTRSGYLR
jgi:hypothetical protein